MKKKIKKAVYFCCYAIRSLRAIPCGVLVLLSKNKKVILVDLNRWVEISLGKEATSKISKIYYFLYLMIHLPEFRSLVYHRLGFAGSVIKHIYPPLCSLYLFTKDIGEGLYIQHGFATGIGGIIGKNCWINQQVSIGYKGKTDYPKIGDNVTIYAGAKILGKLTVGDNSIIGANAVVVKDVPPNCMVVGVPGYIIKRDGKRVKEDL